jgi:hypothetical protein
MKIKILWKYFSWKFAYEAIVNEEIRPRFECYKWENIKAHLDRCREYRSLHLQELTEKLTNEQKQRIEVTNFPPSMIEKEDFNIGIGKKIGCF